MDVEKKVLEMLKPKREEYELIENVYKKIADKIGEKASNSGIQVEVTLQGSIAHDTWLSGDRDLDIFVLFPLTLTLEELRAKGFNILLEAAKEIGRYELRFAEHPYVRVFVNGVEADLVPAFKVPDPGKIVSAVDRTPFHTEYINKTLTPEDRDQVRLLKKFMKTIGVYGAELKTKGFSGYAVELLVAKYKSFRKILEEASNWEIPIFINTLENVDWEVFKKKLRRKYPDSVIYMPDPVDPLRNVTANVSLKTLSTFILGARCYLNSPSIDFFNAKPQPVSIDEVVKHSTDRCLVVLKYTLSDPPPPDVLWGELQRVETNVVNLLNNRDFEIIDSSTWTNEKDVAYIILEASLCSIPEYKLYIGPRVTVRERSESFISKHSQNEYGPWIGKDGRLRSLRKRRTSSIVDALREFTSEYNSPPHLKPITPSVSRLNLEITEEIVEKGGYAWLVEFVLKKPSWMAKCTG
jgi:tRNA nucleotidyltransferase (CCA-adding enzyme)